MLRVIRDDNLLIFNPLVTHSLCAFLELMFLETSALTGENVEEGFLKCARTILNKIESGEQRNTDNCVKYLNISGVMRLFFSLWQPLVLLYYLVVFM